MAYLSYLYFIKASSKTYQLNLILFYRASFITNQLSLIRYGLGNKFGKAFWTNIDLHHWNMNASPGSAFIKPDQRNSWIKDQIENALLSTILHLQLQNFVSCGRGEPSHMTQHLVTVGAKLQGGEWFLFDPWSMDHADLVW